MLDGSKIMTWLCAIDCMNGSCSVHHTCNMRAAVA